MKQEKELQESHFDKKDKKKDKKKEKKKEKKDKHKDKKKYRSRSREKKIKKKSKKYDSSSSSSSSYDSSSYDSSYENNLKMQKVREERKLEKQDLQRKRLENTQQVRPIVKLSSLAGLLKDVKKTNISLDTEEVQRANEKFKQIDHSERTSTLLSGHLTKQFQNERDEYVMEYQNGEYKKVFKPYQCSLKNCNLRFQFSTELSAHMKSHAVQQQKLNQQKANEFAMQLQNNLF